MAYTWISWIYPIYLYINLIHRDNDEKSIGEKLIFLGKKPLSMKPFYPYFMKRNYKSLGFVGIDPSNS